MDTSEHLPPLPPSIPTLSPHVAARLRECGLTTPELIRAYVEANPVWGGEFIGRANLPEVQRWLADDPRASDIEGVDE